MEKEAKKKKPVKEDDDNAKVDDPDSDTSSTHSILSIDPDEPLINNIGQNLYKLACKQSRDERYQHRTRQQNKKPLTILPKKKKLTIRDIDRLFEEKRLRPSTIKNDLYDLYEKSPIRIRSMLDKTQIDQFIRTKQKRT